MYGRKAWAIVGYTYAADQYCPDCIVRALGEHRGDPRRPTEHVLNIVAMRRSIDRQDESSYDSSDFPKVIFASQVEGSEWCGACHAVLITGDQPWQDGTSLPSYAPNGGF